MHMTTYQEFWNSGIGALLEELNCSDELHKELLFVIQNHRLTEIYPNQVINALKIARSIKNNNLNTALVAPMQSGKSGTIFVLVNYILPHLGLLNKNSTVVFVTSMRDVDLFKQNKYNLEKDFYSTTYEKYMPSHIMVKKMDEFFKSPNPTKLINELNSTLIIRDEDQYGSGSESSFDTAFFQNLRMTLPKIGLLAVSATPYDILDAKLQGYNVELVDGIRPEKYFGITEMLSQGLVEDYPKNFRPVEQVVVDGFEVFKLHSKIVEYINHLNSFDDGLGLIRVSSSSIAILLRDEIKSSFDQDIECIAIGSDPMCDYKIQFGLEYVKKQVLNQSRRIVVIVVHALSAGKDLKLLKEKVRFGIESRNKQLANGAQGISGRLCGYHNNRSFKLLASVELLNHYSSFEMDPEVFSDPNWQNELYNQKVRGLSTHCKLKLNNKRGVFSPVIDAQIVNVEDIKLGNKILSFLKESDIEKILETFKDSYINNPFKHSKFKIPNCTLRVASNYKPTSNRVYKHWNNDVGADFSNIFFQKYHYKYGILISNFDVNDHRNELGFRGIKVFFSSEPSFREMVTYVENDSMYSMETT